MAHYQENGAREDVHLTLERDELQALLHGREVSVETDSFTFKIECEGLDLPTRLSLAQRELENAAYELERHE